MIEKMKKLTFLVTDKEYDSFIASLRELGVVHIQQLQKGATSQELQDGMALEQRYKAAIQALEIYAKTYDGMEVPQAMDESTSPVALLQHVEDLQAEELKLLHNIDALQKNIQMLEPWGDFDPASIKNSRFISSVAAASSSRTNGLIPILLHLSASRTRAFTSSPSARKCLIFKQSRFSFLPEP